MKYCSHSTYVTVALRGFFNIKEFFFFCVGVKTQDNAAAWQRRSAVIYFPVFVSWDSKPAFVCG